VVNAVRTSATAALLRNTDVATDTESEPYECGWAGECIVFARVRNLPPANPVLIRPQLSPDGIHWTDAGPGLAITAEGQHHLALHSFGTWIRVVIDVGQVDEPVRTDIYLALKE
jgi:hypothetical protein